MPPRWIGVSASSDDPLPLGPLPRRAVARRCRSSISDGVPLFSFVSRSLPAFGEAWSLHLRHRCTSALLLCLPPAAPRDIWDRRKSPSSLSYQLAHSDAAFILCPSHLRLAGDQPKSAPLHERPLGRADRGSYGLSSRATGLGDKTQVHYAQSRCDWLKRSGHRSRRVAPRDSRGFATSHLSAPRRRAPVSPSTQFSTDRSTAILAMPIGREMTEG